MTQSETVYGPPESDYVIYKSEVCCPRQMIDNQKKFLVRMISRIPQRLNFLEFSLEVLASLILASEKTAIYIRYYLKEQRNSDEHFQSTHEISRTVSK